MSASLVGSEMCIRDSPLQERNAERRKAGGGRPTAEGRSSQRRRQTAGAVSYTHLTLPTICSV
eukprot:15098615-Alexandrium_andersonii.AAC.1